MSQILPPDLDYRNLNLDTLDEERLDALEWNLEQYVIELARKDPNVFCALYFGTPQVPLHKEFQRIATEDQRFLIASMRESGKSTQITVLRALWELGNNPWMRIKIVSVSRDRSTGFVQALGKHIIDPRHGRLTHLVFPELRPDPMRSWSSEQINIIRPTERPDGTTVDDRDPSVQAYGISSSPEGGRADLLIFDDITSLQTSILEPRMRKHIMEIFKGTWLDIKAGPSTRYWYLCTLWHEDDCSHHVMKTPGWNSYIFAISKDFEEIDTSFGKKIPLPYPAADGSQWNKEALIDEFKTRGSFHFDRSFRNNPTSEESRLFKAYMFYGDEDGIGGAIKYGLPPWHENFKGYPRYTGVDLGIGETSKHKPSVIFTIAVADGSNSFHPEGTRIPIDIRRGNWNSPDTARQLVEMYDELRPEIIRVENNYYQQAIIDWLRDIRGVDLPLEAHFTGSQKMHPEYGIPLLAAEFDRDKWVIPYKEKHPSECGCGFCMWVNEMLTYAPGSQSTDLVMACLAPGSLVTTRRGLVPIEEVVEGDYVLTHRARWRKVTGTAERQYSGDILEVKPSGRLAIKITPEHPIWNGLTGMETQTRTNTIFPKDWEFRPAGEILVGRKGEGSYLFDPVPTSWEEEVVDPEIDLGRYTSTCSGGWRVVGDIVSWRNKSIPRKVVVDEDLAMVLGLYLAEGSVGGEPHQVSFAFHEDEKDLVAFVLEVLKRKLGLTGAVYKTESKCVNVVFSCTPLARYFKMFGSSYQKRMPWECMDWALHLKEMIVRGWFLGDGSLTQDARNGSHSIRGTSISRNLLFQICLTLKQLGYHPNMRKHSNKKGGLVVIAGRIGRQKDCWTVNLNQSDSAQYMYSRTYLEQKYWNSFSPGTVKKTNVRHSRERNGIALRTAKIAREDYSGMVYNLHVEGDESYVVGDIAVHNCWFAQRAARDMETFSGGFGVWTV